MAFQWQRDVCRPLFPGDPAEAAGMWDWSFTCQVVPELLQAAVITVEATVLGYLLAVVAGLVWALMRRSRSRWIAWPATGFVEFIRSTPVLVQLYFMFFIFPEYGIRMSAMVTGILGLGLHYSAYTSEVYRAGLEGVHRGQWEAATALNLSPFRTYRDIVIPQAIPPVVPALGNYLVGMFKETPLLSAIAVVEMMQTAKIIGSDTFRYIEPMTLVGVFFLIFSAIASTGIGRLEVSLNRKVYHTRG